MNIWEDLIKDAPEDAQREIWKKLSKKFKKREPDRLPRKQKIALSGKILTLMARDEINLSQQKVVLNFTLKILERGMDQWKNEKR